MKNFAFAVLLFFIYSCSPKYTASFQDNTHSYNSKQSMASTNTNDMPAEEANAMFPEHEIIASTESRPAEFNQELSIFSVADEKHSIPAITEINRQKKSYIKTVMKQPMESPKEGNPKKNGHAIAGFVSGILSLIPLYGMLAVIPAIIFSVIGLKSEKRKFAKAGLIMGSLGIVLAILGIIALSNWG